MVKVRSGDLALVEKTDDPLIKVGSYGVVESVGKRMTVTFNYTTPWIRKKGAVIASGGPVRNVPKRAFRYTGRRRSQRFHKGEPGIEKTIERKVRVFDVKLERK